VREEELLEVDAAAGREEIAEAYFECRQAWSHIQSLVESDRDLSCKVGEVQFYLAAAYHRLLSVRESERRDEISIRMITHPPLPTGEGSAIEPGPVRARDVQTAPGRRRFQTTDSESQGSSPAKAREEVGLVPVEEDSSVSALADEKYAASERAPRDRMSRGQRKEKARQLLRDAKIHIQIQDWKKAIALLYELVSLEPMNASYRGLLAKAMSRHPSTRRKAVGEFIQALRLAPENADLHYSLGLCYKSFGLKSRAGAEFRAALDIEPRHQEARRHLLDHQEAKKALRSKRDRVFL